MKRKRNMLSFKERCYRFFYYKSLSQTSALAKLSVKLMAKVQAFGIAHNYVSPGSSLDPVLALEFSKSAPLPNPDKRLLASFDTGRYYSLDEAAQALHRAQLEMAGKL